MTRKTQQPHDVAELTPSVRARANIEGDPIDIAGQTWLLSGSPGFGPLWDRLYDMSLGCLPVDEIDVQVGACRLLLANYALTADEAVALIRWADPGAVYHAVASALFRLGDRYASWSAWARIGLLVNGLDPDAIPRADLHAVLDGLQRQGRWVSQAAYCDAAKQATMKAGLAALAAAHGAPPNVPAGKGFV